MIPTTAASAISGSAHVIHGEPIHYLYLGLAFLCFAIALPITLVRWYVLVRAESLPFTLGNAFRLGLIGLFFNSFLPGSVGGDLVKAAGIVREQIVHRGRGDRYHGSPHWFVGLVLACRSARRRLLAKRRPERRQSGGAVQARRRFRVLAVAVSLIGWLLLGLLTEVQAVRFAGRLERLPKVGGSAAEFWRAIWMYRRRQASVFLALALSVIGFLGFVPSFYFGPRSRRRRA